MAANSSSENPAPPQADSNLPWRLQLTYGVGGMADRIGSSGIKDLGNPIYNLLLGISPTVIGLVFVVTRLYDAFIDPIVGSWSDNTRSRWGRRKPFMIVGGITAGITIVPVFWLPRWLEGDERIVWMLAASIIFYSCYALYTVPFRALAYEIAPKYNQKTQLLATRTIFMVLSSIVVYWIFPFAQSGLFEQPRDAVPWIAMVLGVVVLCTALVPALWVQEAPAEEVAKQPRISLKESLGQTLRCRPFLLLVGMGATAIVGINTSVGLGNYVTIYYSFAGNARAAAPIIGWTGMVWVGLAFLIVPLLSAVSRRIGKRETLLISLCWAAIGGAGSWWLYSPAHPLTQLLFPVFSIPGTYGLWLFGESMVGDVCDTEALRTGERREAMFSAVFGWILKCATAVAVLLSNLLLGATGFDVSLSAGQSEHTVTAIRWIYSILPTAGYLAAFVILWRFRLGPAEMARVREALDARNRTT